MKKIFKILLSICLIIVLSSCKSEKKQIKVLMPEGIPSIALGSLVDNENYEFTVVSGSSVLSTELMQNNYDVIVAPIILGAQLYSKGTSNYKFSSILTTGNSYVVSKEEKNIKSLTDLTSKNVALYGQNTAPDILFKTALNVEKIDIENLELVYENSVADVLTNRFLIDDNIDAILCAEPVLSKIEITLNKKVGNVNVIDIQNVLKEKDILDLIPQAGIFVNKDVKEKDIKNLLKEIENNVNNLNENPSDYVDSLLSIENTLKTYFEGLGKDVLVNSIPRCNIVFLKGIDNKNTLDNYFKIINEYNSKILNGAEIDEEFYQE